MDAENLYRRLGRLIESAPSPPQNSLLSPDLMSWVGRANALVKELGDVTLMVNIGTAIEYLQRPERRWGYDRILMILHMALASAELRAPPSAQGAFIPVGSAFDAYASVSKILGSAKTDVLVVDPYLDDTVLTEFGASVSEGVPLRLLADVASVKANLAPASKRWIAQHPARPLEVRLAAARTLHDRAIFLDHVTAWTVTQSLKDLAKRSPAEIVRADDTAALKIEAYEVIWKASATI